MVKQRGNTSRGHLQGFINFQFRFCPARLSQRLSVGFHAGTIKQSNRQDICFRFQLSLQHLAVGASSQVLPIGFDLQCYPVYQCKCSRKKLRGVLAKAKPFKYHSSQKLGVINAQLIRFPLQREHAANVSMAEDNSQIQYHLFLHEQKKNDKF